MNKARKNLHALCLAIQENKVIHSCFIVEEKISFSEMEDPIDDQIQSKPARTVSNQTGDGLSMLAPSRYIFIVKC